MRSYLLKRLLQGGYRHRKVYPQDEENWFWEEEEALILEDYYSSQFFSNWESQKSVEEIEFSPLEELKFNEYIKEILKRVKEEQKKARARRRERALRKRERVNVRKLKKKLRKKEAKIFYEFLKKSGILEDYQLDFRVLSYIVIL